MIAGTAKVARTRLRSDWIVAAGMAAVAVAAIGLAFSSTQFLLVLLCVGLVAVAVLRFPWFVYAQVFLLPWSPLVYLNLPLHDVALFLRFVLLAGVWFIRRQEDRPIGAWFFEGKLRKGILVFVAVATVSLFISALGPNTAAIRLLARLFSYVAFFFAMVGWLERREQLVSVIKILLFSTLLVALFGFYQVYKNGYTDLYFQMYPLQEEGGISDWNGRITSFLFHFNSLAGYLNLVLPFAFGCVVLARGRRMRLLGVSCLGATVAALYFTGSRGGLIACGGSLLACLWFLRPSRAAWIRLLLAGAMAVALIQLLPRFQQGGEGEEEVSVRVQEVDDFTQLSRLALWAAAGSMFLDHPVLGVGYGNYRSLYHDYIPGSAPDQLDAHNLYLQLLSETGLIGFLVFAALIIAFSRMAVRLARDSDPLSRWVGAGVGGGVVATLIHGGVDYLFNVSPQFGGLFWLVMALAFVAAKMVTMRSESELAPEKYF
ncbi:MAG TPA: O-antigen ligase family protein [Candidatus Angelobacter sp.]|nr:O-antigen ligase family protein [Candidatus Angelobacter sp.]